MTTDIAIDYNAANGEDFELDITFAVHQPVAEHVRQSLAMVPDDAIVKQIRVDGEDLF